jgi:hypothetical protein
MKTRKTQKKKKKEKTTKWGTEPIRARETKLNASVQPIASRLSSHAGFPLVDATPSLAPIGSLGNATHNALSLSSLSLSLKKRPPTHTLCEEEEEEPATRSQCNGIVIHLPCRRCRTGD